MLGSVIAAPVGAAMATDQADTQSTPPAETTVQDTEAPDSSRVTDTDDTTEPTAVIGPGVQYRMDSGSESIPILVIFETQPEDSLQLDGVAPAQSRTKMKALAEEQQAQARTLLDQKRETGAASDIQTFWSRNALAVEADESTIRELAALENVDKVVYDQKVTPADHTTGVPVLDHILQGYNTTTDPTGIERDAAGERAWSVEYIGADAVHRRGVTGEGVNVSVVDSGIDADHPALEGQVTKWKDFTGDNYTEPRDSSGHGTHVAATIAGRRDAEQAVGVAPEADIFGAKVFGGEGAGRTSTIISAFEWSAEQNADIISASLGAPPLTDSYNGTAEISSGGVQSHDIRVYANGSAASNGTVEAAYKPSSVIVAVQPTHINGTEVDDPERAARALKNATVAFQSPNGEQTLDRFSAGWAFENGEVPADLLLRKYKPEDGTIPESGNWSLTVQSNHGTTVTYEYAAIPVYPTNGSDELSQSVSILAENTGTVPVIAAGNDGGLLGNRSVSSPGAAEGAITVGASAYRSKAVAPFSSRGPVGYGAAARPGVDVIAPGSDVISASAGGGWSSMSGTSMATPHVSGTVALILSTDSTLSRQEVRTTLRSSAQDVPAPRAAAGDGMIDAWAAVNATSPAALNDSGSPNQGVQELFAGIGDTGERYVNLEVDPATDTVGDAGAAPDLKYASREVMDDNLDILLAGEGTHNGTFVLYVDADQNESTGDPDQNGAEFRGIVNRTFDGTDYRIYTTDQRYNETTGEYEYSQNFSVGGYGTSSKRFIELYPDFNGGPYENGGPVEYHIVSRADGSTDTDRLPNSGQLVEGGKNKSLKTLGIAWNSTAGTPASDVPVTFEVVEEDSGDTVANATVQTDSDGRAIHNFSVGIGDYDVIVSDDQGNQITQDYSFDDACIEFCYVDDSHGFPNHIAEHRDYEIKQNSTVTVNIPVYSDDGNMTPYEGPASVEVEEYADNAIVRNDLTAEDGVVTFTIDFAETKLDEEDQYLDIDLALTGNYSNATTTVDSGTIDIIEADEVRTELGPQSTTVAPTGSATISFQHTTYNGDSVNETARYEVIWVTDRMVASLSNNLPADTLERLNTVQRAPRSSSTELTADDKRTIRRALDNISSQRLTRTVETGTADPVKHGVGMFTVDAPADAQYGVVMAGVNRSGADPGMSVIGIEGRTSQYHDKQTEPEADDDDRYDLRIYEEEWGQHREGDYLVPNETFDMRVSLYDYQTDSYVDNATVKLYTDGGDVYTVETNGYDTVVTIDAPDTDWANASFDEREQQVYGVVQGYTRSDGQAITDDDYLYPYISQVAGQTSQARPSPEIQYDDGTIDTQIDYFNDSGSTTGDQTLVMLTEGPSFDAADDVFVGFVDPGMSDTITRNFTDETPPGPGEEAEYEIATRTPAIGDDTWYVDWEHVSGLDIDTTIEDELTDGRNTSVTVTVTDRNGDPVPGAAVMWRYELYTETTQSDDGGVPPERPGDSRVGVTDEDGTISFDVRTDLPEDAEYGTLAYEVGAATANASATYVENGYEQVNDVAEVTVNGTVREADGTPAANDSIAFWRRAGDGQNVIVETDENGEFSVEMANNSVREFAYYQSERSDESREVLFPSAHDGSADMYSFGNFTASEGLTLDKQVPEGHVVNVSVLDEDGDPVSDDKFELEVRHKPDNGVSAGLVQIPTDSDGQLRIGENATPGIELNGAVSISVETDSRSLVTQTLHRNFTVSGDENVTFQLEEIENVTVTGRAVSESGEPLAGDEIVFSSGAGVQRSETGPDGQFTVTVRNGTDGGLGYYQTTGVNETAVSADGVADIHTVGPVTATGNTSLGNVTVPDGYRLNLTVIDENADTIADARVRIVDWNNTARSEGFESGTLETNVEGSLYYRNSSGAELNGPVTVQVKPPEGAAGFENNTYTREFTADADRNETIVLNESGTQTETASLSLQANRTTLSQGDTVKFTLTRQDTGDPVSGALSIGPVERAVSVDASGTAVVTIQQSGMVNVTASKGSTSTTDFERDTLTLDVEEDASITVTYDVESAEVPTGEQVTVTAKVVNSGDVAGNETVTLYVDGTPVANRTVSVDGDSTVSTTFNRSLSRGTHSVRVNALADTRVTVSDVATLAFDREQISTFAGDEQTVNLSVQNVTNGVGSLDLTLVMANASTARITSVDVIGAKSQQQNIEIANGGASADVAAFGLDTADVGTVTLVQVTVAGGANGTTSLSAAPDEVSDENGLSYIVDSQPTTTVAVGDISPIGNNSARPTDIDGDGQLEDLNGDGEFTISDVQTFWKYYTDDDIQAHTPAFDFNGDREVNVVDVQKLFAELNGGENE